MTTLRDKYAANYQLVDKLKELEAGVVESAKADFYRCSHQILLGLLSGWEPDWGDIEEPAAIIDDKVIGDVMVSIVDLILEFAEDGDLKKGHKLALKGWADRKLGLIYPEPPALPDEDGPIMSDGEFRQFIGESP